MEVSYSPETVAAAEMLETLNPHNREIVVDQIRELISEKQSDEKWKTLLNEHPEPMLEMADKALKEHLAGKSKPLTL